MSIRGSKAKQACIGALSVWLAGTALGCGEHAPEPSVTPGNVFEVPDSGFPVTPGQAGFPAPPPIGCSANDLALPGMGVGIAGGGAIPLPLTGEVTKPAHTPPPISGGTMLVTADGTRIVASDPDRDAVYVIDAVKNTIVSTLPMSAGDEPGRLVEDAAGHVHVALRSSGSIATIDPRTGIALSRTAVCDLPRGLAYDKKQDLLLVACAEGKLVSVSPALGAITRTVELGRDLRDVVINGDKVLVTHFRSAELSQLDASGKIVSTYKPPTLSTSQDVFSQTDACGNGTFENVQVDQSATVAWRTVSVPGHGVAMLHQRSRDGEVQITQGGYGGGDCGGGIVQTALTLDADQADGKVYPSLDSMTLPVDVAIDGDGVLAAVAAPGNWGSGFPQVSVYTLANLRTQVTSMMTDGSGGSGAGGSSAPLPDPGAADVDASGGTIAVMDAGVAIDSPAPFPPGMGTTCGFADRSFDPAGQASAVAFVSPYVLAIQTREPATIELYDLRTNTLIAHIDLGGESMADTGHEMFHLRTGAGVACASCHAEGGDDGHVWTFQKIGPRRTQHLRGGILGTEPFHWDGDMTTFSTLMTEVFVGRMSGFMPSDEQQNALSHWVDEQPSLHGTPANSEAVSRGKALFESKDTGCTGCHSGAKFTNNANANVGTGATLQVPSLRSVSFRAPFLHDGCAKTLQDRFGKCGGGDMHGHTSQLSNTEVSDLVSYLESL